MAKVSAVVVVTLVSDEAPVQGATAREISEGLDSEIELFDAYFQNELKMEPLIKFEKACLKTYLQFKYKQTAC